MLTTTAGEANHMMKKSAFQQQTKTSKFTLKKAIEISGLLALITLTAALPGQALEFPQMGDRGAPARTSGGGTRGDRCAADIDNPIRALVPKNNISTFADSQARLWIHIPAELTAYTAEVFVKHPNNHKVIYEHQTALPALNADGLIELTLPATRADGSPLLENNQDYFWEVAIISETNDRSRDRFVQGFLHRMAEDTAAQAWSEATDNKTETIPSMDPTEFIIEMNAGAGLWQETLWQTIRANSHTPTYWNELLASVGLEDLANQYAPPVMRSLQYLSLPQAEQLR